MSERPDWEDRQLLDKVPTNPTNAYEKKQQYRFFQQMHTLANMAELLEKRYVRIQRVSTGGMPNVRFEEI